MRAAIFIDGAHLLKQIGDARISPEYGRLADYLLAPLRRNVPLDLLRCYFYYCPPWMSSTPTEEELRRKANWDRFVAELEDLDRWQVRLGKLERRREGDKDVFSQKRVDVLLSVDMVRHAAAGHIQHVVLVAGDSDFIPAVEAVKESGTTLTLWAATDRSAHLDLIKAADEVQYLRWQGFPQKSKEASRHAPLPPEQGRSQRPPQLAAVRPPAAPDLESPIPADAPASVDAAKKKRRGRRGGRGRNKNRGLSAVSSAASSVSNSASGSEATTPGAEHSAHPHPPSSSQAEPAAPLVAQTSPPVAPLPSTQAKNLEAEPVHEAPTLETSRRPRSRAVTAKPATDAAKAPRVKSQTRRAPVLASDSDQDKPKPEPDKPLESKPKSPRSRRRR